MKEIKFLQEHVRRLEAENLSCIARAERAEAVQLELQKRLDFTIMKLQKNQVKFYAFFLHDFDFLFRFVLLVKQIIVI